MQLKHMGFQSIWSRYVYFRQQINVILQTERDLRGRRADAAAPHLQPVGAGVSFASTRLAGTVSMTRGGQSPRAPVSADHISSRTLAVERCQPRMAGLEPVPCPPASVSPLCRHQEEDGRVSRGSDSSAGRRSRGSTPPTVTVFDR